MKCRLLAAGLLLLLTRTAPVQAQEATPPREMRWYGYQSMVIDASAISLFIASCSVRAAPSGCHSTRGTEALGAASIVIYEFGGPIVHALHGHWPRPLFSAAARVAPILGATLVSDRAARPILLFGVLGAMILDDAFLAHEPAPASRVAVVPTWDPIRRRAGAALAGTF